jgi:signal peptide peptidase SppA
MSPLLRFCERALNRPLLIHPDKLPLIVGVLEGRLQLGTDPLVAEARKRIDGLPEEAQATMYGPNPTASRFVGSSTDEDPVTGRRAGLPYRRTREGVAIIPVIGTLINRGAWVGSVSGETSYEGLKMQVGHAADDPRTTAVLLDIDSPGGEATGCAETADAIRALATKKPVHAVVNGMAASAAYWLASAAGRIIVTKTGVVGSIGIVMVHADYSRKLDKDGITPTLIFSGAHKVDGNLLEPLPSSVRADLQAECDKFYSLFVQGVASDRLTEAQARATEARVFIGADAVSAKLADEQGTFESALQSLTAKQPRGTASQRTPASTLTASANKSAPLAYSADEIAAFINGKAIVAAKDGPAAVREDLTTYGDAYSPEALAAHINASVTGSPDNSSIIGHGWDTIVDELNAKIAQRSADDR